MSGIAILARLSSILVFWRGGILGRGILETIFAKRITFFIDRFSYHIAKYYISILMFTTYVCEKWTIAKSFKPHNYKEPGPILWTVNKYIVSFSWNFAFDIKGKKSHKKPFKFEKNVELWRLIFYPISGNEIKTFWDLLHNKWQSISTTVRNRH